MDTCISPPLSPVIRQLPKQRKKATIVMQVDQSVIVKTINRNIVNEKVEHKIDDDYSPLFEYDSNSNSDASSLSIEYSSKIQKKAVMCRRLRRIACPVCNRKFLRRGAFKQHQFKSHGLLAITCEEENCKERFATLSELFKHRLVHDATSHFPCQKCSRVFTSIRARRVHARKHFRHYAKQLNHKTHKSCRPLLPKNVTTARKPISAAEIVIDTSVIENNIKRYRTIMPKPQITQPKDNVLCSGNGSIVLSSSSNCVLSTHAIPAITAQSCIPTPTSKPPISMNNDSMVSEKPMLYTSLLNDGSDTNLLSTLEFETAYTQQLLNSDIDNQTVEFSSANSCSDLSFSIFPTVSQMDIQSAWHPSEEAFPQLFTISSTSKLPNLVCSLSSKDKHDSDTGPSFLQTVLYPVYSDPTGITSWSLQQPCSDENTWIFNQQNVTDFQNECETDFELQPNGNSLSPVIEIIDLDVPLSSNCLSERSLVPSESNNSVYFDYCSWPGSSGDSSTYSYGQLSSAIISNFGDKQISNNNPHLQQKCNTISELEPIQSFSSNFKGLTSGYAWLQPISIFSSDIITPGSQEFDNSVLSS